MIGLPTRKALKASSNVNLVFDGNSLTYGTGSTGGQSLAVQTMAKSWAAGSGATMSNVSFAGRSWGDLISNGSAVDSAYVPGKINVLVVGETTNSVFNTSSTAAQAVASAQSYINARLAQNPDWRIVLVTTIPRQTGPQVAANQTALDAANAVLVAADNIMRATYRKMGAVALVDVRSPGSPFNFTGYTPADFSAVANLYAEADGSRVHLTNAGYSLWADMIDLALRRLPQRLFQ